jgi:hypothetical protein
VSASAKRGGLSDVQASVLVGKYYKNQ